MSVYHPGSRTTPLEPAAQTEFARYTAALAQAVPSFDDVIVGNEPNLNRFWLPQFKPNGSNASAPAYLPLLGRTYDALKAVDPKLRVWGGALAPRGNDRPDGTRPTSSPTAFIQATGRRLPGQRPPDARDGRVRLPPVPGQLVHEPGHGQPAEHDDRPRRLRQARRPARRRLRRHGAARLDAADPLRRVRDRVDRARRASAASTPATSRRRRSRSTRRSRPRPTTSASSSPSASRTSSGSCSSTRTTRRRS